MASDGIFRRPEAIKMRYYVIRDTAVKVVSRAPAPDADSDLVQLPEDLDQARFPLARLVAVWNALPGAEQLTKFRDRNAALKRLWPAFESLPLKEPGGESKQAQVIAMLRRPAGASIDELVAATGWQRHSVRGVLSGALRKKRGLNVQSIREGERRVYRIAS